MMESNRVEFKQELNESLEREVVGFLNYFEGGEIYIGIKDNGTIVGVLSKSWYNCPTNANGNDG